LGCVEGLAEEAGSAVARPFPQPALRVGPDGVAQQAAVVEAAETRLGLVAAGTAGRGDRADPVLGVISVLPGAAPEALEKGAAPVEAVHPRLRERLRSHGRLAYRDAQADRTRRRYHRGEGAGARRVRPGRGGS